MRTLIFSLSLFFVIEAAHAVPARMLRGCQRLLTQAEIEDGPFIVDRHIRGRQGDVSAHQIRGKLVRVGRDSLTLLKNRRIGSDKVLVEIPFDEIHFLDRTENYREKNLKELIDQTVLLREQWRGRQGAPQGEDHVGKLHRVDSKEIVLMKPEGPVHFDRKNVTRVQEIKETDWRAIDQGTFVKFKYKAPPRRMSKGGDYRLGTVVGQFVKKDGDSIIIASPNRFNGIERVRIKLSKVILETVVVGSSISEAVEYVVE